MTVLAERPVKPILGVRTSQLVAWELAATLIVFGILSAGPAKVPALALGGLLVATTAIRVQRRWLYHWLLTRLRFWARGRTRHDQDASALAGPRTLLPELTVSRAEGRSRVRLGVVHDGRAWVSMVAVERAGVLTTADDGGLLPVGRLKELLRFDDIVFESVQALVQNVTAPSGSDAAADVCPLSYQELNKERVALTQSAWIVLRLDAAACPEAVAARGGGAAGIRRILRRGVNSAVRVLEEEGWQARILDEAEAAEALASTAGVGTVAPGENRPGAVEEWSTWRAGAEHVSYWVRDWNPAQGGLIELQALLSVLPARCTMLSLTCTDRGSGDARNTVLIRTVGATAEATRALPKAAAERGVNLMALDGAQAPGLLATLPLGRSAGPHITPASADRPAEIALHREGLALGFLRNGRMAAVRLLRRESVRLGVFLDRSAAELLVFRLLSAGVTVHVRSPQPQLWASLIRDAGVAPHRMVISLPGGATPPAGSPLAPVAIVDDIVGGRGAPRADLGTWHIGITVQTKVPAAGAEEMRRYDAVLVPRVPAGTARALRDAYELPDVALRTLPLLPPGTAALVHRGSTEILDFAPTRIEAQLFGDGDYVRG
ncbi:type VII secretion protein EccE [Streptomyces sp. NPDC057430]|uniref:type VII secretion protein EccE n=1 Tax=Streptomyces sp. NPDC057430 TaxID=3346131 RepID=UPI0036C6998A